MDRETLIEYNKYKDENLIQETCHEYDNELLFKMMIFFSF
jgi:hypothetical protein